MMVDCAENLSQNDPLGFPFSKVIRMMHVPAREEAGGRRQETGGGEREGREEGVK